MKPVIAGLLAAVLLGCSSQLKVDKVESQPVVPIANEPSDLAIDASPHQDHPDPKPSRKPQIQDAPESETIRPCRNIVDENLWQELGMKFTCIEEAVKK